MKIKRLLKNAGKFLETALTDQRPQATEKVIDLSPKFRPKSFSNIEEERLYANLLGTRVAKFWNTKVAIPIAAKSRLKHKLISPEAVERAKQIKKNQVEAKRNTTIKQDIINNWNANKGRGRGAAAAIKEVGSALSPKEWYTNTGQASARFKSVAKKYPTAVWGKVIGSVGGKAALFSPNEAIRNTAIGLTAAGPIGPGNGLAIAGASVDVAKKSLLGPSVVNFEGRKVTRNVRDSILSHRALQNAKNISLERGIGKVISRTPSYQTMIAY